ncbi:hypothetical protein CJ195_18415 [Bacillus sp. UMB0899]|nr:hypothetical protein CJ195_18415 [Bacillus sp. UMB0899]
MSTLKVAELKKSLKQLEHKELVQLISDLYKMNSDVKDYLSIQFGGGEIVQELYKKAKMKIQDEFFPQRGMPKLRLTEAKKAITDFKKMAGDSDQVIDLMLFYVEMGTEYTNAYGGIDDRFYTSMLSMYDKVAVACDKDEQLYLKLKDRLYSCVSMADGIGWGFHDTLCEIYYSIGWETDEEEEEEEV